MAWMPYLLLVVFVLAWGEPTIKPAHQPLGPTACCRSSCRRAGDRLLNGA